MSLSRRGFLGLIGAAGAASAVASAGLSGCGVARGQTAELLTSNLTLPKPFQVPLPIPPVKRPSRTDGTTDTYDIVQRVADVEILPGLKTPVFGYDGIFPGPTLATRSGRRVVVRHRNELPVPTVVHLHGGHTPPEHDGNPIDLLLPMSGWKQPGGQHASMVGKTASGVRDYVYPSNQRAATLWYHDHRMDFTAPQVYRGLAGFHLIHDDEEDALPLPKGDRDIPLMICDRAFDADGSFRYPALDRALRSTPGVQSEYMEGVLGDVVLVNGAPWPVLEVDAARYRFRILNASNARRFRLVLTSSAGNQPFVQIGSDGGLLEEPEEQTDLLVTPGERFDVVVDFSALPVGTEVTMVNNLGSESTSQVMRFRVARKASDDSRVPAKLSTIEQLDPAKAVRTRDWKFRRVSIAQRPDGHSNLHWAINGKGFDPRRMDATPRLGDIEIWRFESDLHHPVHVHLDPFQVIGGGGTNSGWKDTVDLRPSQIVEVAVRFTDYAGAYMMHCHNLEHEDMAMMAAFRTVA